MNKFLKKIKSLSIVQKVIAFILLIAIVITISSYVMFTEGLKPIQSESEIVSFQVVEGDSVESITTRLEQQGIIKNAQMAQIGAKIDDISNFYVGLYEVDKSWDSLRILQSFESVDNQVVNEVMLTFREGIWAKEIAQILGENTNVSEQALLDLWNDETFLRDCIEKYDFLDESILNVNYPVKLEGFLYPETYRFALDASPQEMTYVFLDQFQIVYDSMKEDVINSGFSVHEFVTLASVVQYESRSVEDMKNIAGVFLNRLDIGMKLESSVTVCYGLYEYDSWEECETNYLYDSPYNTYLYEGLPIGAILNPGKDALDAIVHPNEHEYLFFLADVLGDGSVYYSETYAEHLEKQKQYLGY